MARARIARKQAGYTEAVVTTSKTLATCKPGGVHIRNNQPALHRMETRSAQCASLIAPYELSQHDTASVCEVLDAMAGGTKSRRKKKT